MKNLLVTGCSGFIGMHLCKNLLDEGFKVIGIDNLNSYYDIDLKLDRLKILNRYKDFKFLNENIINLKGLKKIFSNYSFDKVFNLAAQAGVRYSIQNPQSYVESNITGFLNILECCKEYSIKHLIYASSSSVYGGNRSIPWSLDQNTKKPLSIYAVSKITNENMAFAYNHLYGIKSTGLRFFTVYGPWGRPDMAIYIFTKKILNGEAIKVFNYGNMKRDFTYIDDIINGIRKCMDISNGRFVYNLGNNKTVNILEMVKIIESTLDLKANIEFDNMQLGDVENSYADITEAKNELNYSPKNFD